MSAENGSRLAAIMPSVVDELLGSETSAPATVAVVLVVDGLGWHNLRARTGHARVLTRLEGEAIHTVTPSTTGAALSTITTGTMPGAHGLVGYRIRDHDDRLRVTLSEWDGIKDPRTWQLQPTQFERAARQGITSVVIARPEHEHSGLTSAILTGAHYVGKQTLSERFAHARMLTHRAEPTLVYLYIDELDRAGHQHGWHSDEWTHTLEEIDAELGRLLEQLPAGVSVRVTADHGMVDIPHEAHVALEDVPELMRGVHLVGGEPRLRYLYLEAPELAQQHAARIEAELHSDAWVMTRDEAIAAGAYGEVHPSVRSRIGDVLIAAKAPLAFYSRNDRIFQAGMIGQHGSLTEWERTIPLLKHSTVSG